MECASQQYESVWLTGRSHAWLFHVTCGLPECVWAKNKEKTGRQTLAVGAREADSVLAAKD